MRRFQKFVDKLSDDDARALKEVVDDRVREGRQWRQTGSLREILARLDARDEQQRKDQPRLDQMAAEFIRALDEDDEPNDDPFPSR